MTVPYKDAGSAKARSEITRILKQFGCKSIGFMDDFEKHEVLLAFEHRGRHVQLRASAKGWAAMFLKEEPWNNRRKSTKQDYEAAAVAQGLDAINSILRDWVKGQVTAVECGIMSFDAVFLSYILTSDGRPLIDHINEKHLLPPPEAKP